MKLFTVSYRTTERAQRFYEDVFADHEYEAITKVMSFVMKRISSKDFIDWSTVEVFRSISPTEGFAKEE